MSKKDYPPLPEPHSRSVIYGGVPGVDLGTPYYTDKDMHAYVEADRAQRAQPNIAPPDLMTVVEHILDDGHMNTEHLARLRQAWEAATPAQPEALRPKAKVMFYGASFGPIIHTADEFAKNPSDGARTALIKITREIVEGLEAQVKALSPAQPEAGEWVSEPTDKMLLALHTEIERITGRVFHEALGPALKAALAAAPQPPAAQPVEEEPVFRHYKGGLYRVVALSNLEATGQTMVTYCSQSDGRMWTRPMAEWNEKFTQLSGPQWGEVTGAAAAPPLEQGQAAHTQELHNIVNAKRFDRKVFADDSEFADWAQSRARFALATPAQATQSERNERAAFALLRQIADLGAEFNDHTPQSWTRGMQRLSNEARVLLNRASASPEHSAEPAEPKE